MEHGDMLLVSYLRQNSRMSLTSLSKKTGIPISTIFDKLKKSKGLLIQKHVSLLDFSRIGFSTRVSLLLRVGRHERQDAQEYLKKFFNVNSLFKINNGFDFLMEAVFHDLKEVEQFFESLEAKFTIKKKEVFYIIEDVKREEFLADPAVARYVMNEGESTGVTTNPSVDVDE